jgi:hypothetical protein
LIAPGTPGSSVLCVDFEGARVTDLTFVGKAAIAGLEEGPRRFQRIFRIQKDRLQAMDIPIGPKPAAISSGSLAAAPWPKKVGDENRETEVQDRYPKLAISSGKSSRDWRDVVVSVPSWVGIMDSAVGVFSKTVLNEKDLLVSEIRSRSIDDGSLGGEDSERILVARVGNAWHRGASGAWAESLRATRCAGLFSSCVAITSMGETTGGSSLKVPYARAIQLQLLRIDDRGIAPVADVGIGERGYIRDTGTRSRIWEIFFRVDVEGPLRVRIQREVARVMDYSRKTNRVSQATEIDLDKPVTSCDEPADSLDELRCQFRELPGSYVIEGGELHRATNTVPAQRKSGR